MVGWLLAMAEWHFGSAAVAALAALDGVLCVSRSMAPGPGPRLQRGRRPHVHAARCPQAVTGELDALRAEFSALQERETAAAERAKEQGQVRLCCSGCGGVWHGSGHGVQGSRSMPHRCIPGILLLHLQALILAC